MTTDAKFAYLTTAPAAMQLLDWRRRVQHLYADIRAFNDPVAAHAHWVRKRTAMMRYHPQSPFDAQMRPVGHAGQVYHWPYDPEWCFEVSVEPAFGDTGSRQDLGADGDMALSPCLKTVGLAPTLGRELTIYALSGYGGGLFLPFRDKTSGGETYGGGRYLLDTIKGADLGHTKTGALILDFNFSYHPSCCHSPDWHCPLSPAENHVSCEIRAGEHLPPG